MSESLSLISETSVEVPPISKVMSLVLSIILPISYAPTTPPAGPDKIVLTDSFIAVSAEIIPPFDCIILSFLEPILFFKNDIYFSIFGPTYAFITVVEALSYSLNSLKISLERQKYMSLFCNTSPINFSCLLFLNENSKQTAIDSPPLSIILQIIFLISSSFISSNTSPL